MDVDAPCCSLELWRREEFPHLDEAIYLNAAVVGPLPRRALAALEAFHARRQRPHLFVDEDFVAPLQTCRQAIARLLDVPPATIALGPNTSFGLNLAAWGLPLPRGATVLVADREFPANVYPWMALERRGLRCERVPATPEGWPDEAALLQRLQRGDVALLALSAVQFASGYRADLVRLGEACRAAGAYFVVDGIQWIGQEPVRLTGLPIDVLACGGPKWLCGPLGTGFVYVRAELLERLEPPFVGWTGMAACANVTDLLRYRFAFHPDARRYEFATLPVQEFAALAASVELLLDIGLARIAAHVRGLVDRLVAAVSADARLQLASPCDPAHRSAIVTLRTRDTARTYTALRAAGVVASLREGVLRLAPHWYTQSAEIDRVIELLHAHA
jgi:selenocysteine lyase/cysteine desulfurase